MKKNKLFGLLIAVGGVVASMATASALYVNNKTNEIAFTIGSATYHGVTSGTIAYKINGSQSGSVNASYLTRSGDPAGANVEGLGGTATQAQYLFPLSATFNDGHPTQEYVVGKATVTLSGFNNALKGKAHVWIDVQGYGANTLGEYYYSTCFMNSDAAIDSEGTTITKAASFAVASAGVQSLRVLVKLDEGQDITDDATRLSLAESSLCTLSVTWGRASSSDFVPAHVVCNTGLWTEEEYYEMAPNCGFVHRDNEDHVIPYVDGTFEWEYNDYPGGVEAKCKLGSQWSGNADTTSGNHELTAGRKYNVYWKGGDNVATFADAGALV